MPLEQYNFGSGNLTAIRTDQAVTTPIVFGTIEDINVKSKYDLKKLRGQNQFAVAIARGSGDITITVKSAKLNGVNFNRAYFAQTLSSSPSNTATLEGGTTGVSPNSTNKITVAHAATWQVDLGVFNVATGVQLGMVASAPVAGQYTVAAGVYTFAAADNANSFLISYQYGAATGTQIAGTNQLMGSGPQLMLNLNEQYGGNYLNMIFYAVASGDLGMDFKNEDWTMSEMGFEAYSDNLGRVFDWSSTY